jgi:hypothetical protein
MDGKHGVYAMRLNGAYDRDLKELVKFAEPVRVQVYDNSDAGLSNGDVNQIAACAATEPIFWSDDRLKHFMFDFEVNGHWCEMVNDNHPSADGVILINCYR